MNLFTIGFTASSAEHFFTRLLDHGVERVIDVRLNNTSQLSGFAKRDDLGFFLSSLGGLTYRHCPELAPGEKELSLYRKSGDWENYEKSYLSGLRKKKVEEALDPREFANACLLCSEKLPHHCHRRLAAEYLRLKWGKINIIHL